MSTRIYYILRYIILFHSYILVRIFRYTDMLKGENMDFPSTRELRLLHANICKSLGDPKRIQILYILYEQPSNVNALADAMDLPQSTTSRHLAVLRQSSLVIAERNAQQVIYHLADQRIIDVLDSMRIILRDSLKLQSNLSIETAG
jgi:DNA-binding transcriptional ArsR family regulator